MPIFGKPMLCKYRIELFVESFYMDGKHFQSNLTYGKRIYFRKRPETNSMEKTENFASSIGLTTDVYYSDTVSYDGWFI